ncbi:MAG: hypothetical protein AB8C02_14450 [Halioglobus sp.]
MTELQQPAATPRTRSCSNCAAELVFSARTGTTTCEYCGHTQEIQQAESEFEELELRPYLKEMPQQSDEKTVNMLHCGSCGANMQVDADLTSLHCMYCSEPLVLEDSAREQWIVPGAVVPFAVTVPDAEQKFKKWIKSLWFAPNKLKKALLNPDDLKGVYLPYWTFDADLTASYTGQRGDFYYTQEQVQFVKDGKTQVRTQRVKHTRWTPAAGRVSGKIDDTLVNAARTQTLPTPVERWDLGGLKPFSPDYLSGFITEKYGISLKDGHIESKIEAKRVASNWARNDIGGDTQRLHGIQLQFSNETFKHVLLPMYISSFRYQGKGYSFYVNGQTGSISSDRPYSKFKIAGAVIAALMLVLLFAALTGDA